MIGEHAIGGTVLFAIHENLCDFQALGSPEVGIAQTMGCLDQKLQGSLGITPAAAPAHPFIEQTFVVLQGSRNGSNGGIHAIPTGAQQNARLGQSGAIALDIGQDALGRGGLAFPDKPVDALPMLFGVDEDAVFTQEGRFICRAEVPALPG